MRCRSRSRARRTEARLRIRSPASSSSARVTVSLPVRRAVLVAAYRHGRPLGAARAGRRACAGASSSSSAGIAILPAAASAATLAAAALPARSATSRRDSSSLRRDLFVLGALFCLFVGALSSPLPLRPGGAPVPRRACAPLRRRAPPPGAAGRPRPGRRGGATPRRLCARPAARGPALRVLRRSASAAFATGRRTGSLVAGAAGAAGWARATVGAAGSARPASGAVPGARTRFLRTSTVTCLRAAVREALAHLAGLDRPAAGRECRRTAGSAAASVLARWLLARWLQSCASVPPFCCAGRTGANSIPRSSPARPPPRAAPPAATDRAIAGRTADRRQPPRTRSARARTRCRARPPSARWRPRSRAAAQRAAAVHPSRRPAQTATTPASAAPHRVAHPVKPSDRQTGPASQTKRVDSSAAPKGSRRGRQAQARPPPAAARRARKSASPPPAPLYPGGRSTTNPVPAAAPRYRARSPRRDRRQSATERRGRRSRR